ncbi:quinon protein alcohol dehydrogenase-like superfamily [Cladochytrium replicatum]|nr:quinon protein alcohol dehydrogenase-like superfamily [Cladochytrium replicatum]
MSSTGIKGTNIISICNITLPDSSLFVTALALSPDGRQVHVASSDFVTRTLDAATGNTIRTYPAHAARIRQIALRPDNTLLLTASDDRTTRIYDTSTGALVSTFTTSNTTFLSSPNGGGFRAAALTNTRAYVGDADGVVSEYDLDNPNSTALRTFKQHLWSVNTVAVTTDGKFMYSGSDDTYVYKYDLVNSGPIPLPWMTLRPNPGVSAYSDVVQENYYTTPPAGVLAVALFKELYVYVLGTDNSVHVFNAESGTKVGNFSVGTGVSVVRTVAVGKNSTTGGPVIVSAGNDRIVRVWDGAAGVASPREVGRVDGAHSGPVTCVGVSPDMRYFVTAGEDAVVRMWAVV